MTLTVSTPLLSRGTFTASQFVASVTSHSNRTRYSDDEVLLIAARTIHWCAVFGFNHDLVMAQMAHETDWFRFTGDVKFGQHNFAGLGATGGVPGHSFPDIDAGVLAVVAHHAVYRWGAKERWPAHLQQFAGDHVDPRYSAVLSTGNAGKMIVLGDYRGTWAVPGRTYPESLITRSKQIAVFPAGDTQPEEPPVSEKPPIIALAAGHHNTNRGGAVGEYERVGPLTREIARQLRAYGGFDVRMITPDDGLSDFPGGLQDVAREAVRLNADLFLEVHMEGNGAGDAGRGAFAIYPDWPPDVDDDVKYTLGPDLARRVQMLTHLPLRGSGLMSEKDTGVGRSGYRLGAFSASASARMTMTRLLFEYGALTSPRDKAIIDGPEFNTYAAQATVDALVAFYGVKADDATDDPRLPAKPHPDARGFPQTGQWLMLGFKAYWEQFGNDETSIAVFGLPLTGELPWVSPSGAHGAIQYFERAVFEYHSDIGKVLLRRLGAEALEDAA